VTTPDRSTWRYLYDPLGRRIAKQRVAAAGHITEQTIFTWDGPVLAEQATTSGDTAPAWLHVADGDRGGTAAEGVITWDYRPGTFSPLIQTERHARRDAPQDEFDQRFYAIVTDLIGAPAELVSPAGTLAGYQQRTLWGTTLWRPGGASTPLRFPGQYADRETGLHYNHHRYYDPATGRYLTPDPLGLAPAPNPHTYVPNPTVRIDPLGLASEPCLADGEPLAGSGPVSGVLELSSRVKSIAALENFNPATARNFVFDPGNERLLVGEAMKGGGHWSLANSIGMNEDTVVGGEIARGPNGEFLTNELSGHYGVNWTNATRMQFTDFMARFGFLVVHARWGG
jgi:RHS repeat-associated protein